MAKFVMGRRVTGIQVDNCPIRQRSGLCFHDVYKSVRHEGMTSYLKTVEGCNLQKPKLITRIKIEAINRQVFRRYRLGKEYVVLKNG